MVERVGANIENLKKFSQFLDEISAGGGQVDAASIFQRASAALPGTDFGQACAECTTAAERAFSRTGERMAAMADAARGNAHDYKVAEDEFAAAVAALGVSL